MLIKNLDNNRNIVDIISKIFFFFIFSIAKPSIPLTEIRWKTLIQRFYACGHWSCGHWFGGLIYDWSLAHEAKLNKCLHVRKGIIIQKKEDVVSKVWVF